MLIFQHLVVLLLLLYLPFYTPLNLPTGETFNKLKLMFFLCPHHSPLWGEKERGINLNTQNVLTDSRRLSSPCSLLQTIRGTPVFVKMFQINKCLLSYAGI